MNAHYENRYEMIVEHRRNAVVTTCVRTELELVAEQFVIKASHDPFNEYAWWVAKHHGSQTQTKTFFEFDDPKETGPSPVCCGPTRDSRSTGLFVSGWGVNKCCPRAVVMTRSAAFGPLLGEAP